MKYRSDFTIVELLVVIAIISILVSLLMPALRKAKETAKISACQNNHKQISLGMTMYYGDHGFIHTLGADTPFDTSYGFNQGRSLRDYKGAYEPMYLGKLIAGDYIGSGKVLYCPAQSSGLVFGDEKSASEFFTKTDDSQYVTIYYRLVKNTATYHHGSYQYMTQKLNAKYKRAIYICMSTHYGNGIYAHAKLGVNATFWDGHTTFAKGACQANYDVDWKKVDAAY